MQMNRWRTIYHCKCLGHHCGGTQHRYSGCDTSEHSVLMTQHSAYVWHPLHCKWHRIHSFTSNHRIYEVTSSSGMTSQPCIRHHTHCIFIITSSPLISHPLLYDITPTFCVRLYSLNISWHPILISSHYSTDDITTSIYETTSSMRATYTLNMWHHSHYLGHHTHSIGNITPTLFMISHSPYMSHRVHYTRHHILTFLPQTTILRT